MYLANVIGKVLVASLCLHWICLKTLSIILFIMRIFCCIKGAHKLRTIVIQNLKSNKSRNLSSEIILMLTVMFMIFIRSYNKQMPTLFILKLKSLSGGDFFVYNWMPSDKVLDQSWRTDLDFKQGQFITKN